ncbi:MAG: Spy/CpxP family protein refolding chaperone [Candidatus Omnitrophica bacterium]|nr:Spy/CpxP family protein refolding chaperone [Candidatus Omnitrophota bacterium]
MKLSKVFWMVALAGVILSPRAFSQEGPGPGPMVEKGQEEIENKLGLSQEQREKIKAIRKDFRAKQEPLAAQIKEKREALRLELDGDKPDRKKVEALVAEVTKLQGQTMLNHADMVLTLRPVFTPEQYQKLKEIQKERRAKLKADKEAGRAEGAKKGAKRDKK